MPQLQINQGPQDALLYDNTRSYFTNVSYVRTSNFQMELRDVDSQNSAQFGSTVQFVIPKAADLLGCVDLLVKLPKADSVAGSPADGQYSAWVEALGYAMIESMTFSIGSHDIEKITGDQLNIINELMKTDAQRLDHRTILKTGHSPCTYGADAVGSLTDAESGRLIHSVTSGPAVEYADGRSLIIPLSFFFTKHPSAYFPLAAIAGCNDVRISIKLRQLDELIMVGSTKFSETSGEILADGAAPQVTSPKWSSQPLSSGDAFRLRCHYIHVTGPEATALMNKEHVRLLKLWQNQPYYTAALGGGTSKVISFDLSFLHPVQELIITLRKTSEMSTSLGLAAPGEADLKAFTKSYFSYQGSGRNPNQQAWHNCTAQGGLHPAVNDSYVTVKNFKLTLNGQDRHPSLASSGLDRDYLMNRLMPMLHSNTSDTYHIFKSRDEDHSELKQMLDRKEIYVYPFCLAPESANPSGAVNFSKVSHAKLSIEAEFYGANTEYVVDVYGVHYNWLQIKDGRALTSFA